MTSLKQARDVVICIALLVFPLFVLRANVRDPADTDSLDRLLLKFSAPFQYAGAKLARGTSRILQRYAYLVDVRKDNERLQNDNDRLRRERDQLTQYLVENHRLRGLLGIQRQYPAEWIPAQVVAREVSPYFRVIRLRLGVGELQTALPGSPVVSGDGLVGQVQRPIGRYADVLLTVDPKSAVDVVIPRTGAHGVLRGTGDSDQYRCTIQYLARTDEVAPGDLVYTSGLVERFPKGILLGRVTEVRRPETGLYQDVNVVPEVDFANLDHVLVMLAPTANVIPAEGSEK